MRNILIVEKIRWDSLKSHYFEVMEILDLIIVTDDDTFKVVKNRNNYNELDRVYPIAALKFYTNNHG